MSGSWCHLVPADEIPCSPQPQDLEAPPAHAFKMTSFKKVKACGICRQAITRQGSTCRGELGPWARVCMGTGRCQGGQDIGGVCVCPHARGSECGNLCQLCMHRCACVLEGEPELRECVWCFSVWEGGWEVRVALEPLGCCTCTGLCVSFMHVQWACSSHRVCAHGCGSVHTWVSPPEPCSLPVAPNGSQAGLRALARVWCR